MCYILIADQPISVDFKKEDVELCFNVNKGP